MTPGEAHTPGPQSIRMVASSPSSLQHAVPQPSNPPPEQSMPAPNVIVSTGSGLPGEMKIMRVPQPQPAMEQQILSALRGPYPIPKQRAMIYLQQHPELTPRVQAMARQQPEGIPPELLPQVGPTVTYGQPHLSSLQHAVPQPSNPPPEQSMPAPNVIVSTGSGLPAEMKIMRVPQPQPAMEQQILSALRGPYPIPKQRAMIYLQQHPELTPRVQAMALQQPEGIPPQLLPLVHPTVTYMGLSALELAMRSKGSLSKTIMQCVFVGPPRSGKSSLMKRIVGERPTPSSPSTGVADKVVQVEIVRSSTATASVSGSTWVKLSHDEEAVMVVMDTAQSRSNQAPVLPSPSRSDTPNLKPSVDFCKRALQRNLQYAMRFARKQSWLVYLTDTGGQIEFQELLPLLVSGPSVFFLVFRLDQDLNKQFMVEYVRSTGATSDPYQSNFTVKEALLQSLASIASMGKSKVFFVGTHKDKVSEAEINCIDHTLQNLVKSTSLYQQGMIQCASKSQMLLAVNNLSQDDSDVQLVRAAVERLGSQGDFSIRSPVSWLIFSLTIRQHTDRVLSYEQCFEVARQCGIATREELNETLRFLHTKVGLIRYFQGEGLEDLQRIVITDPQILFDMMTDLVVETFTFDKVDPVIREYFKKMGIFPFSTFERISGSSQQLLTPSRLVKLLEHLHIIAPLEEEEDGERRYFMPCVLAHTKLAIPAVALPGSEQTPRPSAEQCLLVVGFRCGYCPKGLFAALVVYLLANTKSCFQWVLQKDRIFRDQISFSVGPYDTVTITVWPKFLEISCTPASSEFTRNRCFPPATACGEVRRYIERGIREVTSALHYTRDAAHYLAFYCPGDHRGPDPREPHPAEINFHGGVPCTLRCELAEKTTFRLPPGHERWFTEVRGRVCMTVMTVFQLEAK